MSDLVEGRRPVLEALKSGRTVHLVLVSRGIRPGRVVDEIRAAAKEAGVPVEETDPRALDAAGSGGEHQGVLAEVAPFAYATIEDVLAEAGDEGPSLVAVLDHVVDPRNLGAVVRSAEALGAHGVVVPKRRSAPMSPAALKAAAGAAEHIPIARVANVAAAIEKLKESGFWVFGASEEAEQAVWDAPLEGRVAVVVGAEGRGLAARTLGLCDFTVRIPTRGRTTSFNVAQAFTVVACEWARRTDAGCGP